MAKVIQNIENLKINRLTQEQYDEAQEWGEIKSDEVYIIPPPRITISTSVPTASDGVNGEVWLVYTPSTP